MREDIADYLPIVFRKLGWLTPEELITRVVALNFNRFLDYYKDAKDLNFDDSKPEKKAKGEKKDYDDSGLQRLFFSKGKKDKIKPNNIIGKINDVTGTKDIRIGRIDMMENFSFVDVDQDQAQFIVDCFADERKNREGIRVEITTSEPKPKKKKEKKQFDDDRPERKNRDVFGDRSYKLDGKRESRKESRRDSKKDSRKDSRKDRKDSGRRGRNRSR
jgi:ATP-dependent RNA helicase DeaD